jgi:hypothetical protein
MLNDPSLSRASPLPQVFGVFTEFVGTSVIVGAGLAREEAGTFNIDLADSPLSRASSLPQVFGVFTEFVGTSVIVGAGLAREEAEHSTLIWQTVRFREQARSHRFLGCPQNL